MRKGTLILSAILTGVVLALLVMLVSTYRKVINSAVPGNATQAQQTQSQPQQAQSNPNLAATPAAGKVGIYEAAASAASIMGHDDVYITEYAQLNGVDVYLVTFRSGDLVYMSLDGQVISTSKQEPISVRQPTSHR
jgi:hypothetical protein